MSFITMFRCFIPGKSFVKWVLSNALNTDTAIELQRYAKGKCLPSYGIGTHFTNDFPGIKHLNIVWIG